MSFGSDKMASVRKCVLRSTIRAGGNVRHRRRGMMEWWGVCVCLFVSVPLSTRAHVYSSVYVNVCLREMLISLEACWQSSAGIISHSGWSRGTPMWHKSWIAIWTQRAAHANSDHDSPVCLLESKQSCICIRQVAWFLKLQIRQFELPLAAFCTFQAKLWNVTKDKWELRAFLSAGLEWIKACCCKGRFCSSWC